MKNFQINSTTNKTIFKGAFSSFQACLRQAIADNVKLHHADLSRRNLTNLTLDGADLTHADFSHSNLTGANLSETQLRHANFYDADLYNTCFAFSDLRNCDFKNASFGATDIAGCDISNSTFSSLSCFTLDFALAKKMNACRFINPDGSIAAMARPPIVIRGLSPRLVVLMDRHMKIGHDIVPYARLRQNTAKTPKIAALAQA